MWRRLSLCLARFQRPVEAILRILLFIAMMGIWNAWMPRPLARFSKNTFPENWRPSFFPIGLPESSPVFFGFRLQGLSQQASRPSSDMVASCPLRFAWAKLPSVLGCFQCQRTAQKLAPFINSLVCCISALMDELSRQLGGALPSTVPLGYSWDLCMLCDALSTVKTLYTIHTMNILCQKSKTHDASTKILFQKRNMHGSREHWIHLLLGP